MPAAASCHDGQIRWRAENESTLIFAARHCEARQRRDVRRSRRREGGSNPVGAASSVKIWIASPTLAMRVDSFERLHVLEIREKLFGVGAAAVFREGYPTTTAITALPIACAADGRPGRAVW